MSRYPTHDCTSRTPDEEIEAAALSYARSEIRDLLRAALPRAVTLTLKSGRKVVVELFAQRKCAVEPAIDVVIPCRARPSRSRRGKQ